MTIKAVFFYKKYSKNRVTETSVNFYTLESYSNFSLKIKNMSTVEAISNKMLNLPSEIQLQVLDYVDYLAKKYEEQEKEEEVLLEKFLNKRLEEAQANPEKLISVEALTERILSKHSR